MAAELTTWEILTGIFMPIAAGAFGLVWKRQEKVVDTNEAHHDELWEAINEQRNGLAAHREATAKDYITKVDFNRLEAKIDRLGDILRESRE
jgi:hypothetical protein